MNNPLFITFDIPSPDTGTDTAALRLPKLVQGAPYEMGLRVRSPETGLYRDFSQYDEVRMQLTVQQGVKPFLSLSSGTSGISLESDHIHINLTPAATRAVKVPVVNRAAINELRFLHTITLYRNGVEVERFAQGFGYLTAEL